MKKKETFMLSEYERKERWKQKLIDLLYLWEEDKWEIEWERIKTRINWEIKELNIDLIISKEYWFIWDLIKANRINRYWLCWFIPKENEIYIWWFDFDSEELSIKKNISKEDLLVMVLSVSKDKFWDLINILL